MTFGSLDSYCKRVAMASPNPETDERNMKNKDNTKLAKIKKLVDSCVLRVPFAAENISSAGQLLTNIFFTGTRLFWD